VDGQKIEASVCVGVATFGGQVYKVADLLGSADAALYRAKWQDATASSWLEATQLAWLPVMSFRLADCPKPGSGLPDRKTSVRRRQFGAFPHCRRIAAGRRISISWQYR
jgi:hypothetical protein